MIASCPRIIFADFLGQFPCVSTVADRSVFRSECHRYRSIIRRKSPEIFISYVHLRPRYCCRKCLYVSTQRRIHRSISVCHLKQPPTSPRNASPTPPSRRPAPGSASAASSSLIRAFASLPLAVGSANIVGHRPALANQQSVRFSLATNRPSRTDFEVPSTTIRPCGSLDWVALALVD